ncbi:MAG: hypothetical protein HYX82_03970 [Chloroflexi bacterium]|nr:hypothetical protein [Chloroflexota bacterium]
MKRLLLIVLALVSVTLFVACAPKPTPTPTSIPTPAPTPTPTFEQKRLETVSYLRAYNKIDNDLDSVASAIQFPASSSKMTATELIQFNNALGQLITASQGALQRVDGLTVPNLDEARSHLQDTRRFIQDAIAAIQRMREAINSGNQSGLAQAINDFATLDNRASAINRATESLMLKYNITDTEVDYRFRGK